MSAFPTGKSIFIWKVKEVHNGDDEPAALAKIAKDLGFSSVLVKIADGTMRYNLRPHYDAAGNLTGYTDDLMKPLVDAFHAEGLEVWGWQYVYGGDPVNEANIAAERIKTLGVDGFIIDAEKEYKAAGMGAKAEVYLAQLLARIPADFPVGLSTYRYPTLHNEFPWNIFMPKVDFWLPQVYWVQATNPGEQLERSLKEYRDMELAYKWANKPYIPVGAAYREFFTNPDNTPGSWEPTPAQIVEFHEKVKALGLPGESFWEWGSAIRYGFEDDVAALKWDVQLPPPPVDPLAELKAEVDSLRLWAKEMSEIHNGFVKEQVQRNAYLSQVDTALATQYADANARLLLVEKLEARIAELERWRKS